MAGLAGLLPTHPAAALDLKADGSDRGDTPARREGLRTWDNSKTYGAERVMDRERRAFQPDGLRFGNFLLFPSAAVGAEIDDNVFVTPTDTKLDFAAVLEPTVWLRSSLPRHVLDVGVGAKIKKYSRYSELDTNDVFGAVEGALHFDHAHTLSVSALSAIEHEELLAGDDALRASERTQVWRNRFSVGLRRDAGRLHGSVGGRFESWDYSDPQAAGGGRIDVDYRDLAIYSSDVKLGYRFSPGFEWQARLRGLRQLNRGTATRDLDAWGYEAITGLSGEFGPLYKWRLLGGYGFRDYDDPAIDQVGTGLFEAALEWLPTELMTVTFTAQRAFTERLADFEEPGGSVSTSFGVRVDYEILRNLLFTIDGEYRQVDFINSSRRDEVLIGGAGLEYLHTKNWQFSLRFEHQERDSNTPGQDLDRNRIWLSTKLKF